MNDVSAIRSRRCWEGDCGTFKRESGRSASQRVRIESVDPGVGTVTLSSALHWDFLATERHRERHRPVGRRP